MNRAQFVFLTLAAMTMMLSEPSRAQAPPTNPDVAKVQALAREALSPALDEGRTLFKTKCGMCHNAGNTGTIMLARRLGVDQGLLAGRINNLPSAYVESVVRSGIGGMPTLTRVELTNVELSKVANYLGRNSVSPLVAKP